MLTFIVPILIISLLIILNGLFVSAEFSIAAIPKTRITQLINEGSQAAVRVGEILNTPKLLNRFFTTAQVGITLVSLALGMYGEHTIAEWLLVPLESLGSLAEPTAHTISLILSVGFLTYMHVVVGEMIPKSLALQSSEKTIFFLFRPMYIFEKLLYPLIILLNNLGIWITKLLGVSQDIQENHIFTPEELEFIVEESFEEGLLESSDQLFIENILDLERRTAEQVMTPRNRIKCLAGNSDLNSTLDLICKTTKTRYPIYEETLDNIIGILHIKDLSRFIAHNPNKEIHLPDLARPTLFLPETLPLDELLIRFRKENHQIAILIDEFGGTAGLVTLEDLIEEVVGEIRDEFDIETNPIQELSGGILRVKGNVILDELEQLYGLSWEETDDKTIGGFVMTNLGDIPRAGDEVILGELKIMVESVQGFAVDSLLIYLPKTSPYNPLN